MEKITADSPEAKSADIVAENVAKLKELFPEAFAEDGIDFDVLKQLLGGEVNEKEEKYSFMWPGKRQARQIALTPSLGTLRPAPEESVNWDTTQNLFIEGDNLEVLKLLQKSYSGKVKMIYIDPPYNTGKDFVYNDDFKDSINNYLWLIGDASKEGERFTSNPKSSGRYHSNWLNMITPRLRLAKNLLRDDGMVFISIDDNEVHNLRKICDDIFGEENFLSCLSIMSNPRGRQSDTYFATVHDFILIYAKNIDECVINGLQLSDSQRDDYEFEDNDGESYRLLGLRQRGSASKREDRPDMFFPIYVNRDTREILFEKNDNCVTVLPRKSDGSDGRWMWGKEKCKNDRGRLVAKMIIRRGEYDIFVKDYLNRENGERTRKPKTIWVNKFCNNQFGTQEVKQLLQGDFMSYPKPKELLMTLCHLGLESTDNDIVLDFFAGSATTAHAAMQLNQKDHGNRRFILVQLPEPYDENSAAFNAGYKSIAEIGKERIRRVIKKIKDDHPDYAGDLGFRVFKLDSSNIRPWNPDAEDVAGSLLAYTDNLLPDRTEQDLLYEVLLKFGLDLTSPMQENVFAGHTVYSMGQGVLFACLSKTIAPDDVEPLGLGIAAWRKEANPVGESTVIFRDSAFAGDVAKANMTAILQQYGIDNVRSL